MKKACVLSALACLATAAVAQADGDANKAIEPNDVQYPTVITPTRLSQSLTDVPASVTVLTAETLRRYGITSIPEALRLVPGMAVTQATGNNYHIGYHGTNFISPRRMNVLIDGMSVYRPAFSEVVWTQLPVTVEDIDRIEVTRGTDSAAYGPNSMLAVVNIVTKHPKDVERGYAAITAGSQNLVETFARTGFNVGSSTISLSASHHKDSGFDTSSADPSGHDGLRLSRFNVRSHTKISEDTSLDLSGAVVRGVSELGYVEDYQVSYPDGYVEDGYFNGLWTQQLSATHQLQVRLNHSRQQTRQSWRSCLPTVTLLPEMFNLWRANPAYARAVLAGSMPSGGSASDDALAASAVAAIQQLGAGALSPTCVTANQDAVQQRTDLEVQDTFVMSERLRVVSGFGVRKQSGDSQTYLGGTVSNNLQWLFANVEGRPTDWATINLGGYYEHNSLSPSTFSPRAGVNFKLSPSQTLRFIASRGTRSPDIQEQRTNWSYTFTDLNPPLNGSTTGRFFQSRSGPGNLVSERIESREAGYLFNAQSYGLMLDLRLFHDKLTDLISERPNLAGTTPTNQGSVALGGLELQTSWRWGPSWTSFANYAYLDNRVATNVLERGHYSRHSGSVGLSHEFGNGWSGSAAYFGASGDGLVESSYGRKDLTLIKSGEVQGLGWTATIGLRRFDNTKVTWATSATASKFGSFNDRVQGFIQLSVRLP